MNERGFTLLELLVALAVISIAALTLMRLDAFALRSAGDLDAKTIAQITVHNRGAEIMTDAIAPAIGTATIAISNAGRSFAVEQRVTATADPALLRIDLIARPTAGQGQAVLTIIRPAS